MIRNESKFNFARHFIPLKAPLLLAFLGTAIFFPVLGWGQVWEQTFGLPKISWNEAEKEEIAEKFSNIAASDSPSAFSLKNIFCRGQLEYGAEPGLDSYSIPDYSTIDEIPAANAPTLYYSSSSPTLSGPFDSPASYSEDDGSWTDHYWADEDERASWQSQFLPEGLIYPSYLAGRKEPRLASIFTHDSDYGWLWDITLGGRVPLYRFGTTDPVSPEGFQIDMEGAALLRLDFERQRNLAATDYRAGLPLSYGTKHWQYKFGYYHVSSHLGDNYLLDQFRPKVHYVRDELIFGISFKPIDPVRLYAEAGWAFNTGMTTEPWEFQFGAEFSPDYDPRYAKQGAPYAAICGHLFEELDFGGYFNSQIGWQWRSPANHRLRLGAEFYCGCDDQFQFHYTYQKKVGVGFWYDF